MYCANLKEVLTQSDLTRLSEALGKGNPSHRKADADGQTTSARARIQLNRREVPVGNALDDGESQTASRNIEFVPTKESVEDAPAISDWDTRPGILDGEQRMMIPVRYGDIDPPTGWRVADCVVNQVTQHDAQGLWVALNDTLNRIADSDVDLPGNRQRCLLGDRKPSNFAQVCWLHETSTRFGLLTRQGQELADQVNGPRDTALQIVECGFALCASRRPSRQLQLQLNRSERRTQLMCSIGDKAFLRGHRTPKASQQIVQGVDQGLDFLWKVGLRKRLQCRWCARTHSARYARQGPQTTTYRQPDQRAQQWEDDKQRRNHAKRHGRGELLVDAQGLSDLYKLVMTEDPKHAPATIARRNIAVAWPRLPWNL